MQHFITWASRINTLHASVSYGYSAIRRSALIIFSGLKPASYNQSMYTFQATETSEQYEVTSVQQLNHILNMREKQWYCGYVQLTEEWKAFTK